MTYNGFALGWGSTVANCLPYPPHKETDTMITARYYAELLLHNLVSRQIILPPIEPVEFVYEVESIIEDAMQAQRDMDEAT